LCSLTEGKNREIRQVMRHLELHVNRLIRQSFGPFRLGDILREEVHEVPRRQLIEQLGGKFGRVAAESGVEVNKSHKGWAKAKAKPNAKRKKTPAPRKPYEKPTSSKTKPSSKTKSSTRAPRKTR